MSFPLKFSKKKNIFLLATGGTGGHVFPAISLYMSLKKKGIEAHISTDMRGKKYIEDFPSSIDFSIILKKNLGSGSTIKRFLSILPSCIKGIKLLMKLRPKAVISFGGYPAFPICIAAKLTRTPLLIHEQNSVLGLVNKIFSGYSKGIMLSFPQTKYLDPKYKKKTYVTGNFVRQEFFTTTTTYDLPNKQKPFNILALGGSQGTRSVAEKTIDAIQSLPDHLKKRIYLTLQAPEKHISDLEKKWPKYKNCKIQGEIKPFFHDIPNKLNLSHLVIARSGASTVWEILAAQRPAIFFPFSSSSDNHQYYNALYLKKHKSAWMLKDSKEGIKPLQLLIEKLLSNPSLLKSTHTALEEFHHKVFRKNPLEFVQKILQSTM